MIGSDEKEVYNLAAETSDDLEDWMAALSKAMNFVTDAKSCMKILYCYNRESRGLQRGCNLVHLACNLNNLYNL